MSKQSFLANLFKRLSRSTSPYDKKNISAKDAINMQLEYISSNCSEFSDAVTPPYIEVAKQMFSEKTEIFQASVYYLTKIAQNEKKYAAPILELLKEYSNNFNRSEEDKKYLSNNIAYIEKCCSAISLTEATNS